MGKKRKGTKKVNKIKLEPEILTGTAELQSIHFKTLKAIGDGNFDEDDALWPYKGPYLNILTVLLVQGVCNEDYLNLGIHIFKSLIPVLDGQNAISRNLKNKILINIKIAAENICYMVNYRADAKVENFVRLLNLLLDQADKLKDLDESTQGIDPTNELKAIFQNNILPRKIEFITKCYEKLGINYVKPKNIREIQLINRNIEKKEDDLSKQMGLYCSDIDTSIANLVFHLSVGHQPNASDILALYNLSNIKRLDGRKEYTHSEKVEQQKYRLKQITPFYLYEADWRSLKTFAQVLQDNNIQTGYNDSFLINGLNSSSYFIIDQPTTEDNIKEAYEISQLAFDCSAKDNLKENNKTEIAESLYGIIRFFYAARDIPKASECLFEALRLCPDLDSPQKIQEYIFKLAEIIKEDTIREYWLKKLCLKLPLEKSLHEEFYNYLKMSLNLGDSSDHEYLKTYQEVHQKLEAEIDSPEMKTLINFIFHKKSATFYASNCQLDEAIRALSDLEQINGFSRNTKTKAKLIALYFLSSYPEIAPLVDNLDTDWVNYPPSFSSVMSHIYFNLSQVIPDQNEKYLAKSLEYLSLSNTIPAQSVQPYVVYLNTVVIMEAVNQGVEYSQHLQALKSLDKKTYHYITGLIRKKKYLEEVNKIPQKEGESESLASCISTEKLEEKKTQLPSLPFEPEEQRALTDLGIMLQSGSKDELLDNSPTTSPLSTSSEEYDDDSDMSEAFHEGALTWDQVMKEWNEYHKALKFQIKSSKEKEIFGIDNQTTIPGAWEFNDDIILEQDVEKIHDKKDSFVFFYKLDKLPKITKQRILNSLKETTCTSKSKVVRDSNSLEKAKTNTDGRAIIEYKITDAYTNKELIVITEFINHPTVSRLSRSKKSTSESYKSFVSLEDRQQAIGEDEALNIVDKNDAAFESFVGERFSPDIFSSKLSGEVTEHDEALPV
ncbi:hypothetical protein [Candidatus Phycorickettsia trachydisci]|nr:hypothetical protein [Candidatus Phycorickettsia trachydisci]